MSLTLCLGKVGALLSDADKLRVLDLSAAARGRGLESDVAALEAAEAVLVDADAELAALEAEPAPAEPETDAPLTVMVDHPAFPPGTVKAPAPAPAGERTRRAALDRLKGIIGGPPVARQGGAEYRVGKPAPPTILRSVDELIELAHEHGEWADWYERHTPYVEALFGEDARLFEQILAATSQQQTVLGNVTLALRAYEQMVTGQPFTGALPAVIRNLERLRDGEAIRGQKIAEFGAGAAPGNQDAIAVDRHVAQLLFDTSRPTPAQVQAAKGRIREVSALMGWTPKQVQAALWAANQTRKGVNPKDILSYEQALERRADLIDAIHTRLAGRSAGGLQAGGATDALAQEPGAEYDTGRPAAPQLTPEQEQQLLPVLADLLDAAVQDGQTSFRAAAARALADVREALGPAASDALTLKHLQGAYISMSSRYPDGAVDGLLDVARITSKAELETADALPPTRNDEGPGAAGGDAPVGRPVVDGHAGPGRGGEQDLPRPGGRRGGAGGGASVPYGGGSRPGEGGVVDPADAQPEDAGRGSRGTDYERGDLFGDEGAPADPLTDEIVEGLARATNLAAVERRRLQREAEATDVVLNDADNVRATLPMLLPEQQEDVVFAEARLTQENGYGVLFTNGTGTGKTFTGLGVIKRFVKQGKGNVLILVPDANILSGWVRSGPDLGINVTALRDTRDAGTGVVVTTYANLRDNNALIKRRWDLIVADEMHEMGSNADGALNAAGERMRALSMHPESANVRAQMANPQLHAELEHLSKMRKQAEDQGQRALAAQFEERLRPLYPRWRAAVDAQERVLEENQGAARTRVVGLSATPFAYEQSVILGQGYLYDWNEGFTQKAGYNSPSAYGQFMIQHFGWRMRYGRLTQPDEKVDRSLLQRQFNTWLKRQGALRGRLLDAEFDYDRRFVLIDSKIGSRIDQGLLWFWNTKADALLADAPMVDGKPATAEQVGGAMWNVRAKMGANFKFHARMRLLEAIKAEAAVDDIRAHLAMGRKVIVFHDRIQGERIDPFNVRINEKESPLEAYVLAAWRREFADLVDADWAKLKSPIVTMREAFGDQVRELNGQMSDKAKVGNVDWFNDDRTGPAVLTVQSDKDKGWSGHDTTGKHQRVIINLGLPTRPTRSIQQEGRGYRVGLASNVMFRYYNTGTMWERTAFAQAVARRSSTVENLALGEEARGLLDSFIDAFENAETWAPGFDGEGTGGKERDRSLARIISEFDRARALYYGQLKKTSRTKAAEGVDYFATPEPVGLKMVQWLDLRAGESSLEPSAGHGAIARWLPENTNRTAVEPSPELQGRLALAFDGDIRESTFEAFDRVNKADGIAMNPPFNYPGGNGGKIAFEHLDKAYNQHLTPGGRIVALLPEGPAADARLRKWLEGESPAPADALIAPAGVGRIFKGDTVSTERFPALRVISYRMGALRVEDPRQKGTMFDIDPRTVKSISPGPYRTVMQPNSPGAAVVATIRLPAVTFSRAGTGVRTRIVVIDKMIEGQTPPASVEYDLSGAESVEELFSRIEDLGVPPRAKPRAELVEEDQAPQQKPVSQVAQARADKEQAKAEAAQAGAVTAAANGLEVIEHITQKGKTIHGVVLKHVATSAVRDALPEAYAFNKNGGVFIQLHVLNPVLERFPLPPVASEEAAIYTVREPDRNYDLDLFGQPVPTPVERNTRSVRPAPRESAPATTTLAVRESFTLPGVYHVTTQVVEVGRRPIPVERVRDWGDAALALSSLARWSVEHFDVLVTDKSGRPLAIVGSFKGDATQTAAYPHVVMLEALRIKGAARAWGVHNHPAGRPDLSYADTSLSEKMGEVFGPSSVEWMGIAAVADDGFGVRFQAQPHGKFGMVAGLLPVPGQPVATVPVIERQLSNISQLRAAKIDSPETAAAAITRIMLHDRRPGVALLSNQHQVVGWVPMSPEVAGALRAEDRYDLLMGSVSQTNATAAIISNPDGALPKEAVENLIHAIRAADVRALDVLELGNDMRSWAQTGSMPPVLNASVVFDQGGEAEGVALEELQEAVEEASRGWANNPNAPRVTVTKSVDQWPADLQVEIEGLRAWNTARAAMRPNGDVFIAADRYPSIDEAVRALFHEVYGHFGLRAYLGTGELYEKTMGMLLVANPALAAEADAWNRLYGQDRVNALMNLEGMTQQRANAIVRALAAEEALANRAGDNPPPRGWKNVMALLQRSLRRHFGAFGERVANWLESMTEAETHQLLMAARRAAQTVGLRVEQPAGPVFNQTALTAAPAASELRPSTSPIDVAFRIASAPLAKITAGGYNLGVELGDRALSVFGNAYEHVKAGFVAEYGLKEGHTDAKAAMKNAIRVHARKTKEIVGKLMALDDSQSRIAYLWMSTKEGSDQPDADAINAAHALFKQLPEEPRRLLESIKLDIEALGEEAVRLGLLSKESFERNRLAYLNRSYKLHLNETEEAKAMRARAVQILGDTLRGRGMKHYVGMEIVGTEGWWQRKTNGSAHDPSLKGKKFTRLELRSTPDVSTPQLFEDENGQKLGRLRDVVYWPEDEPIPPRYADWRVDGMWEARFFNRDGKVGMWRDFTLTEREKMGEVREVKYAVASTMMKMVRDIETARFLEWVARNESEIDESKLPTGAKVIESASPFLMRTYLSNEWVRVPSTYIDGTKVHKYGALAGRLVPGAVWNDVKQMREFADQGVAWQLWSDVMRYWKIAKTALSPVTHMNNIMANFIFADVHDVQARHIYQAARALMRQSKDPEAKRLIEAFEDNGGEAGMFNENEIQQEVFGPLMDQLRDDIEKKSSTALVGAAQVVDLLHHRQIRQAIAAAGQTKAGRVATWIPRKLMAAYSNEDVLFRLAAFIKARDNGLSDAEAGKFARDSFVNYDINAPWVNALRKTTHPFIAFSYRAYPMLLKEFARKPHKLLKYIALAHILESAAYALLGGDDDEEFFDLLFSWERSKQEKAERALMPDEKAGKIFGIFPKLVRMPWNDDNGNPVFLDVRRWVPAGDIFDAGQHHAALPFPPVMMPGGPALLIMEVIANKSSFTGKELVAQDPIDGLSLQSAQEWADALGNVAEHLWKGMTPNFPGIPGQYSTEALSDALGGRLNPGPHGDERSSIGQAVLSTVGVKVASYPVDTMEYNAKQAFSAEVGAIQRRARQDLHKLSRKSQDARDTMRGQGEDEKTLEQRERIKERMEGAIGARRERLLEKLRDAGREPTGALQ